MARNDEPKDEAQAKPQGKKTKTLILIAVAVVAGVGLSVGVTLFVLSRQGVASAETAAAKKPAPAEKKAPPVIYPMDPFIVNIRDGQDIRYMKVKVELETSGGQEVKAEIDPYLAPIRDAVLTRLSGKTLPDLQDVQGKNRLREEILAATGRILPPGKIKQVYFTDFVVQ